MAEPNILTLREVAELLKVHPSSVYKLLRQRRIPAFRIGVGKGSDWRFNREQVDAWRLKQTAQTAVRGK